VQFRRGDRETAVATLRKAWDAAPEDADTAALAAQNGVSFASPPVAAPAESPLSRPPAGDAAGAVPPLAADPVAAPSPSAERRPTPAPVHAEEHEETAHRSRGPLAVTAALVVVLAILLAGWGVVSGVKKRRALEIDRLLRQSRDLIEKDAAASYREAARLCERIVERDPAAIGGHAYLAYIDAIRWGELGEGDSLRGEAQRHLEAVQKLRRSHSHAHAAQAYLRAYGGDPRGAATELQEILRGPEGASPLLRGVLGIVELQAGNLDGARDALTTARQHAPGDVRITEKLAEQWQRRGAGSEPQAFALYDAVLTRLEPNHVPALLGKAQLLIDVGQPAEALKLVGRVVDQGQNVAPRQLAAAQALRERAQSTARK
jgi:tetratricopeptide (TPR) repeat protein